MVEGGQVGECRADEGPDCGRPQGPDLFLEDSREPAAEVERGAGRGEGVEPGDAGVLERTQAHPGGPVVKSRWAGPIAWMTRKARPGCCALKGPGAVRLASILHPCYFPTRPSRPPHRTDAVHVSHPPRPHG